MHVIPHLSFDGQCEAAFRRYEECLGGEITLLLTYGSQGVVSPPEFEGKIFHATLKIGDQTLTGADIVQGAYCKPQGFSVQLNVEDAGQARRIFACLSIDGMVHVPTQATSWAEHYAAFTDGFGVPWEINCGA